MKYFAGFASMLVLLVAPAFGAGSKPQNVVIPQNVQVGSTQLPAGTYKLAYTGTGNVQVTLTQAGKTVLTFPAKAIDKNTVNPGVDLITNGGSPISRPSISARSASSSTAHPNPANNAGRRFAPSLDPMADARHSPSTLGLLARLRPSRAASLPAVLLRQPPQQQRHHQREHGVPHQE
jgi:hypothetical protein